MTHPQPLAPHWLTFARSAGMLADTSFERVQSHTETWLSRARELTQTAACVAENASLRTCAADEAMACATAALLGVQGVEFEPAACRAGGALRSDEALIALCAQLRLSPLTSGPLLSIRAYAREVSQSQEQLQQPAGLDFLAHEAGFVADAVVQWGQEITSTAFVITQHSDWACA